MNYSISIPAETWDKVKPEDRKDFLRSNGVPVGETGWTSDVGIELKTENGKSTWVYSWND